MTDAAFLDQIIEAQDNPEAHRLLREMANVLWHRGGYINPGARLRVNGSDITVAFDTSTAEKRYNNALFSVPEELLPDVSRETLVLDGDRFDMGPDAEDLGPDEREFLDLMIRIYNATGKVTFWRRTCPLYVLYHDTELIKALAGCRTLQSTGPPGRLLLASEQGSDPDPVLERSFIASRVFGLPETRLKSGGSVLMPFIDFVNHHPQGASYQLQLSGMDHTRWLIMPTAQPKDDTDEVFAYYKKMDALDAVLQYGYPETETTEFTSVPLDVASDVGIRLIANAETGRMFAGKVPDRLAPARPYIPRPRDNGDDWIRVNKIVVPTTNMGIARFRRAMEIVLGQIKPNYTQTEKTRFLADVENAVLQTNRSQYVELEKRVQNARQRTDVDVPGRDAVLDVLSDAIRHQLSLLDHFEERANQSAAAA